MNQKGRASAPRRRSVILVCGSDTFRWPEAPPTFFTLGRGGAQMRWVNPRLVGEQDYVPVYDYSYQPDFGGAPLRFRSARG